jgi:hypothetical protein
VSPYYFGDFLAIESLPPQPPRCCHRAATVALCAAATALPPSCRQCHAVALLPSPCRRQAAADVRFCAAADVRSCAAATAAAAALLPPRCRCRRDVAKLPPTSRCRITATAAATAAAAAVRWLVVALLSAVRLDMLSPMSWSVCRLGVGAM